MNRHRCNVKKEKSIVASEIKWTEWKRQGNRNSLRYSIFNALSKRLKRETKESQRRLSDAQLSKDLALTKIGGGHKEAC